MNFADIFILLLVGLSLFTISFRAIQRRRKAKAAGMKLSCCDGNCGQCRLSRKH